MITLAVIGVLVSVAIPSFISFQCRSRISEARSVLKGIYTGNLAYYGEHETFTDQLASLGLELAAASGSMGTGKYYAFEVSDADEQKFSAKAVGLNPRNGSFRIGYIGLAQFENGMVEVVAPACD